MTVLVMALAIAAGEPPTHPADVAPGHCRTVRCDRRMKGHAHAKTVRRWKRTARPYDAWLRSTRACESGGSGGYALSTTGNGFWFAYQHTAQSWYAAGGRSRSGRPAGVHALQPEPAEQDYRAVITLRQQGRGAWPVCG